MKKYGLGFDDESIKESIIENYTGRNHNLRKFIEFLNSQENYSKIALDGDWGSGKTYFIKQLQYVLNPDNKQNFKNIKNLNWINDLKVNYELIYFDSWKYEGENIDPIISLFDIIQKNYTGTNLKKALNLVMKSMGIMIQFKTKGIIKSKDFVKGIKKLFNDKKDPIDEFNHALNNYLNKVLNNQRLVIIIDELDRCKPTYAVNLLERVQHCLDNDKLTFVFSTNLNELSNTVKQIYGSNFDGDSYLDRFFDYILLLPEPNFTNYYDKVISPENHDLFNIAAQIAKYFNFTLRQVNHYFSRISLLENKISSSLKLSLKVDSEYEKHYFLIKYFATFMIALKMSNNKDYNAFLKGNKGSSIINFLKKNRSFKSDFYYMFSHPKDINSLKEEQEYAEIVKIIYTGLFNNNYDYYDFDYPNISCVRFSGDDIDIDTNTNKSNGGDIDKDRNYLLDIVSLIGEDIEY